MPHELWLSERFDFSGQKNISLKCGQNNLIHLIKYVGWSAIALSNGNICVNYFSLSLSFSQHTSAQKTVDELGFDQGTMSEFMKKIQYQLGLAASYH